MHSMKIPSTSIPLVGGPGHVKVRCKIDMCDAFPLVFVARLLYTPFAKRLTADSPDSTALVQWLTMLIRSSITTAGSSFYYVVWLERAISAGDVPVNTAVLMISGWGDGQRRQRSDRRQRVRSIEGRTISNPSRLTDRLVDVIYETFG